ETDGECCQCPSALHLTLPRLLEPDVTSAGRAGIHQLPHQSDALVPKLDELGVLYALLLLREAAVDRGNAVLEVRDDRRCVTAQHTSLGVVLLQGVFECRGLLLHLTELSGEPRARRL